MMCRESQARRRVRLAVTLSGSLVLATAVVGVPAQASPAPSAVAAQAVAAAVVPSVVPAKKPQATLVANYTVAADGKIVLNLTSNAKKATVKYRTAKGKTKTKKIKFKNGAKTLVLPAGSTLMRARTKATKSLAKSPWVYATLLPPPDTTPPGPVTGLATSNITAASITLAWTNPGDGDLAEILVRRAEGAVPPPSPAAGTPVTLAAPTATGVVDSGLTGNTTYSYTVFTRDATGNINPAGVSVTAKTLPATIAQSVLGPGVTKVSDATGGDPSQSGYVDGFVPGQKVWLLSTGLVTQTTGSPGFFASTALGLPGDGDLSAMVGGADTHDAVYYATTLIPAGSTLHVRYVFASEEYPEYVGSTFNDVMAVFVNGVNCALVPGATPGSTLPVAVNNVNAGENAALFVDNQGGAAGYNSTLDGLTVPLTCSVPVVPGAAVTVKIAVADTSDEIYDSAVALTDQGIWSD